MLRPSYDNDQVEAGCDEAGRGCLAGPVFAAAVILPPEFSHPMLKDSKKLSAGQRNKLRKIIEASCISCGVASADQAEIDQLNILNASILAMHRAIAKLDRRPGFLLVDGNRFHPYQDIPHATIVRGDGLYMNIAAASVLAKTYRDDYMAAIDREYPAYGWINNKGYATEAHRQAILKLGPTPHHRRTFTVRPLQYKLTFK